MRRFANPLVAALLGGSLIVGGCGSRDPEPEIVTNERRSKDPPDPNHESPFANPDKVPPGARNGELPPPEQVEKLLADAKSQIDAGKTMAGATILRRCANKIPRSVACEAAIGIALSKHGSHRAHARYYLAQAAEVDDPQVSIETYRALAQAAYDDGQYPTAAAALSVVTSREGATAGDYSKLAGALSADAERRPDAVDAYAKAFELDGTRYEDLRKQAVLMAQLGRNEEAIAAFETFIEKAGDYSPHRLGVENRISELKEKLAKAGKTGKAGKSGKKPDAQ